jgi:hypothetical protein
MDFGVFIAYLLPGIIALYGLVLVVPPLRAALKADAGHLGIGGALIVTIIALTIGRILSIGRAAIVDPTFAAPLPVFDCAVKPYRGAIPAIAPDYRAFFEAGHREAFILAVGNEQRPYQFCGNTAVAVVVSLGCWLVSLPRERRWRLRTALLAAGGIALAATLYAGARSSYFDFMRATAAVNGVEFSSFDRFGRPCRPPAALR